MVSINPFQNGWSRITTGLDVEIQHGIPVRVASNNPMLPLNEQNIPEKVLQLTGLTVSVHKWINITPDEQESSVCVDIKEFKEVLRRLALSSAALFVDRFHKAIDRNAVDWDEAEYTYDFNHAINHCCASWGELNKEDYYEFYTHTMHEETVRLVNENISPLVEAE